MFQVRPRQRRNMWIILPTLLLVVWLADLLLWPKAHRYAVTDPEVVEQCLLGNEFFKKREYRKAIDSYSHGLELAPNEPTLLSNRGHVFVASGLLDSALLDFNRAVVYDSLSAQSFADRGMYYVDIGDYRRGIKDLTKSIEIAPDRSDTRACRSFAFRRIGAYSDAIEDADRWRQLERSNCLAYHSRAIAFLLSGDTNQAVLDYQYAIDFEPEDAWAYLQLYKINIARRKAADSKRYLDSADKYDSRMTSIFLSGQQSALDSLESVW